jgi:hypothetical protein
MDIRTLELTLSEETGLLMAQDPKVIQYLNKWNVGSGFEKLSRDSVASAAAIGLIRMPDDSAENMIRGGMAVQTAWLKANSIKVSVHPCSAPIFLLHRLKHSGGEGLTEKMIKELSLLEGKFDKIFPNPDSKGNIFMFRINYAADPTTVALRRDLKEILYFVK